MNINVKFHVVAVSDSHGTWDTSVCNEMADDVQICGMCDKDGKSLYFESDAYHLERWCNENNLWYRHEEKACQLISL